MTLQRSTNNLGRALIVAACALLLGACGRQSPPDHPEKRAAAAPGPAPGSAPAEQPDQSVQRTESTSDPAELVSGAVRDGIAIRSPHTGLTVSPGESFKVVIEPRNGFVPRRITVGWKFDVAELELAPYTATMRVPDDAVGRYVLHAMATDAQQRVSFAPGIEINVSPRAALTGLVVEPGDGYLFDLVSPAQIYVFGIYGDGVTRRLEGTTIPVQYSSDNEKIARVNEKGQVTGVAEGDVTIRARVGKLETTTIMHVHTEAVATVP